MLARHLLLNRLKVDYDNVKDQFKGMKVNDKAQYEFSYCGDSRYRELVTVKDQDFLDKYFPKKIDTVPKESLKTKFIKLIKIK